MNQHYYECAQDSELGKKISDFWTKCSRCETEAEKYAKAMGAKTYYEDPQYFAGGCLCVAFAEGVRIDPGVWREAGKEQDSGTVYYAPDVQSRTGCTEIPNREYALKDTFDRIYRRDRILTFGQALMMRPLREWAADAGYSLTGDGAVDGRELAERYKGKLFVPYVEFYRSEPAVRSNGQPRTASRGLRKAIKAEIRRRRLPVMRTEDLLAILGADLLGSQSSDAQTADAQPADGPKKREVLTPTFFPHRSRYFIGCAYPCTSPDLLEITPQIYRMNQDKHEREMKRKAD